ncbi:MAG TPA: DsbE family thiol:disulfide interchange protein [Woeseiaceae bacterium]|nr:DsbE family thiol:disulfide interchange protein [Woeseiaceae bacterium]
MRLRYVAPILAFAILLPMLIFGLQRDPSELPSPYLNKPAPAFELPNLRDPEQTVSHRDYAGQVVLVNVWATWCVGCRQEHEFLLSLAATGDVPIYGLNWRDRREDAIRWLDQLGDPYVASGFDEDGTVGIDWGVYGAPETFLIGPDGTVLHKHLSPLTPAIWERDFLPKIAAVRDR